eukprot:GILI01023860.1.p1 GENE.GILI01023860.1~~GILI01023860.1.p1  ORF type:complete len:175 (-),score=42.44 GILI01023860.1:29-553(-)
MDVHQYIASATLAQQQPPANNGMVALVAPPPGPAPAIPSPILPEAARAASADFKAAEMDYLIQKMLLNVATTSERMSKELMALSDASKEQLNEVLLRTSQFAEVLLQSSSFVEFEADAAAREAFALLQNIQEIHKKTEYAQRLLIESKNLSYTMNGVEIALAQMEARRGLEPMM